MNKIIPHSVESLIAAYGIWGSHANKDFSRMEWLAEVIKGYTQLGYWEWVSKKVNQFTEPS